MEDSSTLNAFSPAAIFFLISKLIRTDYLSLSIILKSVLLCIFPFAVTVLKIVSPSEKVALKDFYKNKIKSRFLPKEITKTAG